MDHNTLGSPSDTKRKIKGGCSVLKANLSEKMTGNKYRRKEGNRKS